MKRGLKNICLSILGFSAAPILTACYGVEYEEYSPTFNSAEGYVVDSDLNPIENIRISSADVSEHTFTDKDGHFRLQFNDFRHERTITAKDVDGAENGEFENKSVRVTASNYNNVSVILDEK